MTAAVYEDRLVTLHHQPFEDVLPGLGELAQLAVVDPPYGDTSLDWDRCATEWVPVVSAAVAPAGSVWLWGSLGSLLAMLPVAADHGWRVAQDLVWEKQNGSNMAADRFRRVHEHVVHLYRGAWGDVFHDPQVSLDATERTVRRRQRPAHCGDIGEGAYRAEGGGPRMLRSVLYERNDHGRAIHPTQKPLGLTRTLVQYACPAGGLVIDPYAGSATTLVAARDCGRRAVGCEVNADYVERATARLAAAPLDFDAVAATS